MKDYGDEQVWVVPRDHAFGGQPPPHGFTADGADALLERALQHGRFVPRGPAETDASLQQIIPYAVIVRDDTLLLLKRTARQTEVRLHDLCSIGVGGHINPEDAIDTDAPDDHPFWGGLARELAEELECSEPFRQINVLGIINDDSNPVGQVHLGVAVEAVADGIDVRIRETDAMTGRFVSLVAAREHRDAMETWSQFLLDALVDGAGVLASRSAMRTG